MKVNLCGSNCCPAVEIEKDVVKIGEKGNLCTLKKEEWNSLRNKIINGQL